MEAGQGFSFVSRVAGICFSGGTEWGLRFDLKVEPILDFLICFEVVADFGFMVWQEWRAVWICGLI